MLHNRFVVPFLEYNSVHAGRMFHSQAISSSSSSSSSTSGNF